MPKPIPDAQRRALIGNIKAYFLLNVNLWEQAVIAGTNGAGWNNDRTKRMVEVMALCGTALTVACVCIPTGWGAVGKTLATSLGILKGSLDTPAKAPTDANTDSLRDKVCSQITVAADAARKKELEFANHLFYTYVQHKENLQSAGQSDALKAEIWNRMFKAGTTMIPVDSKQGLQDFVKKAVEQLFAIADQHYHAYFETCQTQAAKTVPDTMLGTFTYPQRLLDETLRLVQIGFMGHLREQSSYQRWKREFLSQWVAFGVDI